MNNREIVFPYETGAEMWRDYKLRYGAEAADICNSYLNMQIFRTDPEEVQFCKELYAAMQAEPQLAKEKTNTKRGKSKLNTENSSQQAAQKYQLQVSETEDLQQTTDASQAVSEQVEKIPFAENEAVKELFSILRENGKDTTGLASLLGEIEGMQAFVQNAESKIAEMKKQLDSIKEVQNSPIKTALQNAIKSLEKTVAAVKEHLGELKANVISGCKSAVMAFKKGGISALDKLASFFHIKSGLQAYKRDVTEGIKQCDTTISRIENFANQYHSGGRAIKNMVRIAVGKEPVDTAKENGKLAAAISKPYRSEKANLTKLKASIEKSIAKLEQLETAAVVINIERKIERKQPLKKPLLTQLAAQLERVAQEKLATPAPARERAKAQETTV
jgi:hypothetical protein